MNIYIIVLIIILLAFMLIYLYKDKLDKESFTKNTKEMFENVKRKVKKIIMT